MECKVTFTFVLAGVISLINPGLAVDTPQLVMKDSSGFTLYSPVDVMYGEQVAFECTFLQIPNDVLNIVELRVQATDGSWNNQGECQFNNGGQSTRVEDDTELGLTESSIECDPNQEFAKFTFALPLSTIEKYECRIRNPLDGDKSASSSTLTLKSYSRPEIPVIQPSPITVEEEKSITISCFSSAWPVPELSIQYDGLSKATSDSSAVVDSSALIQNSSVEWTIPTVSRTFNGDEILCTLVAGSHPYEGTVETKKLMHVIYGPDSDQGGDNEVTHNQNSGNKVTLDGTMAGYPSLSYKWYIEGSADSIHSGALYEVDTMSIAIFPTTYKYTVVGKNTDTGKTANKTFTLIVTEKETTSPNTGSSGGENEKGLENWEIAVIVVAIIIVAAATIGAIILCRKRRNSSSAFKSKAAQARRSSDERNETSKYQTSTASLARQDTAGRSAAYHENPTLPMEYRYSQANVEQYAEVIDDMPRSRKPIALEELDMFDGGNGAPMYDGGNGAPMFEEAPPAYGDMNNQYRMDPNYSAYSPNAYGASYGAAC